MSTKIQINQLCNTLLAKNTCAIKLQAVQKLSINGKEASVCLCRVVPSNMVKIVMAIIDPNHSFLLIKLIGLSKLGSSFLLLQ